MRRTTLKALTIAAAGALALTACTNPGGSGNTDEDKLVIYSSHPIEMIDFFTAKFKEANPGVEVELITGGTGELLGRVKAEAAQPQGDVLWGGGAYTGSSAPDLFTKFDDPVLQEIGEELRDPAGFNAPAGAFTMLIVYNKDLVPEADVPQTWQDLADPKWKGLIGYANPASSSSAYNALVAWKVIGGWELVESIAKNLVIADSSSAPFTAVGNGEAPLGVAYEEGAYRWLPSGKVGIVYPSDGVIVAAEGLFQIANAPNPTNAKKFAQFMLAVEQQQALVDNFEGRRPTNSGVTFPDAMPPASELNLLAYPPEAQTEQAEWLAEWNEIMVNTR